MRCTRRFSCLVILCPLLVATLSRAADAAEQLLVSSRLNNQVLRYDGSGASIGWFDNGGDVHSPNGVVQGPDGMIYVSSRDGAQVLRYRFDGSFDRVFASGVEMIGPSGLTFGPSGDLYVALAGSVKRAGLPAIWSSPRGRVIRHSCCCIKRDGIFYYKM